MHKEVPRTLKPVAEPRQKLRREAMGCRCCRFGRSLLPWRTHPAGRVTACTSYPRLASQELKKSQAQVIC